MGLLPTATLRDTVYGWEERLGSQHFLSILTFTLCLKFRLKEKKSYIIFDKLNSYTYFHFIIYYLLAKTDAMVDIPYV